MLETRHRIEGFGRRIGNANGNRRSAWGGAVFHETWWDPDVSLGVQDHPNVTGGQAADCVKGGTEGNDKSDVHGIEFDTFMETNLHAYRSYDGVSGGGLRSPLRGHMRTGLPEGRSSVPEAAAGVGPPRMKMHADARRP